MGHCESHLKHFPGKIFKMWSRTLILCKYFVGDGSFWLQPGSNSHIQLCQKNIFYFFISKWKSAIEVPAHGLYLLHEKTLRLSEMRKISLQCSHNFWRQMRTLGWKTFLNKNTSDYPTLTIIFSKHIYINKCAFQYYKYIFEIKTII